MKKYFGTLFLIIFSVTSFVTSFEALANNNRTTPEQIDPADNDRLEVSKNLEEDPILTIKSQDAAKSFTRSELLASPFVKKVTLPQGPSPGSKSYTYTAIPASKLFSTFKLTANSTIAFYSLDGFDAPISTSRLLNSDPKQSIAYIAIELASDPWPKHLKDGKSRGPYYLIWEHPEKSHISKGEWPFQLAGFEVKGTIADQFPHVVPDSNIKETDAVMKGYRSFTKNCFACHSLNGEGLAHVGPDLNIPYNPTEYLKPEYLEILVRKPTSLRKWEGSRMSPFSRESLSDEEYGYLTQYLKYMAKHKYTEVEAKPKTESASEKK